MHRKSDVDRLYLPKNVGGRGLTAIKDCAEFSAGGLDSYVHGSQEKLLQGARGDRADGLEAASVLKKAKKEKTLQMGSIYDKLKN